jgi:hypothetical protein
MIGRRPRARILVAVAQRLQRRQPLGHGHPHRRIQLIRIRRIQSRVQALVPQVVRGVYLAREIATGGSSAVRAPSTRSWSRILVRVPDQHPADVRVTSLTTSSHWRRAAQTIPPICNGKRFSRRRRRTSLSEGLKDYLRLFDPDRLYVHKLANPKLAQLTAVA